MDLTAQDASLIKVMGGWGGGVVRGIFMIDTLSGIPKLQKSGIKYFTPKN